MEDVLRYVTDQLSEVELGPALPTFSTSLARESSGLFEWARLACAYVKGENSAGAGLNAEGRFTAIMTRSKEVPLLDGMYRLTLETMFPKEEPARRRCIDRFKSVMAQILGTMEPLPLASLEAMRHHFVDDSDIDVRSIVIPMGVLLGGTADPSIPIRALHASFPDFLIDRDRSGEYFIDVSPVRENLAFSCLRVMENGLQFNICQMPSSYLPNSRVPDLKERVKEHISPELSYSCRFWTVHVCNMPFNASVANVIHKLFSGKELLFWFEALSLLKSINTCAGSLSSLIQWIMVSQLALCIVYFLMCTSPRKSIKGSWMTQQMHKDFFVYSVALFPLPPLICTCLHYHFRPRVQVFRRCLRTSFIDLQR